MCVRMRLRSIGLGHSGLLINLFSEHIFYYMFSFLFPLVVTVYFGIDFMLGERKDSELDLWTLSQ